jgi:hypothetical protein
MLLTRRNFLERTLKISAGFPLASATRGFAGTAPLLTLRQGKGAPVRMPANFTGLGYEMSSVARLGLLSAGNDRYVRLVKGMGTDGVLRVGGIVSDYTRYEPDGKIVAQPLDTVITSASLRQFGDFLSTIGWSAIWTLNFAQGSIEDAVKEARAVTEVLGPHLLAFEIGNEVENFARGHKPFKPFRKAPYTYETYRTEYHQWHAAIVNAVPQARFAAPDTAASVAWVERMAKDAKGDVQLLTTHYYRNGQARGTMDQLLYPDPRLKDILIRLRAASEQSGIPWRMCETNSFSGGGHPGISDTFAGALWTLDFMLLLAAYGCSGVNIETGVNQLGFVSSYSAIQDNGKGINSAGAPYYGMLAFAQARTGSPEILPLDFDAQSVNLTAYLLGASGKPRTLVIVNKDPALDARISIRKLALGNLAGLRLIAPASDSKTGITFGGASVSPEGQWRPAKEERIRNAMLDVPRMSAVVLRPASGSTRA